MSNLTLTHQQATRRRLLQWSAATALTGIMPVPALARDTLGQSPLKGAGSTFVTPLIHHWMTEYRNNPTSTYYAAPNGGLDSDLLGAAALDYEAVGSLAGLQRLQARAVNFALSELPLSAATLKARDAIQLPVVLGGVAIVAHLPRLAYPLRLDGATLAGIFRGRITRWNAPEIAAINPSLTLPDIPVVPIHRVEGSGTTYTLTRYLATQDSAWKQDVGVDALVNWPLGTPVRGSKGMGEMLQTTAGAIGYLDAVQAVATGLPIVQIKNATGHYVLPDSVAIKTAAQSVSWPQGQDKLPQLVNAPGQGSYPIAAMVLAVLHRRPRTRGDRRARAFLSWALDRGQKSATALGYTVLPESIAAQVRAQLN